MCSKLCVLAAMTAVLSAHAGELIWWEAETAAGISMEVEAPPAGSGLAAQLSAGKWVRGKVAPGLFAEYEVTVANGGRYNFFARTFWQHGAFRWRFDDATWVAEEHDRTVVDTVKEAEDPPLCWLDLGYVELTPGPHRLRIELLPESKYPHNKEFGFDCFALSDYRFLPRGLSREGGPVPPLLAVPPESHGRWLARTMVQLASATPERHTPVRILCYGQSIIGTGFPSRAIADYLKRTYPNAEISVVSRAIGGYTAPFLRLTAWQDLYPYYPDLVVFHVYGGEDGEFEEILRNIRTYTTAEILTWTHHVDLTGSERSGERDEASRLRVELARKYGCEIADVRGLWKEHLKTTHLPPADFLRDSIHPNPLGGKLLGELLVPHFTVNDKPDRTSFGWIRELPLDRPQEGLAAGAGWRVADGGLVTDGTAPLKLEFTGNRVDVEALGPGTGSATILLDGQPPSALGHTYAVTRSSKAPGAWWPALSRIEVGPSPVADAYTISFHDVSPDGASFTGGLRGATSGADGSLQAGVPFVSTSGRIRLDTTQMGFAKVHRVLKKDLPPAFDVTFKVYSMSHDTWRMPATVKPGEVPLTTLIQSWRSGPHTLEIIPAGDGPIRLRRLVVHTPPLGEP